MMDGFDGIDDRSEVRDLLSSIQRQLPQLEALLKKHSDMRHYEDPIYRFYHSSFKVYGIVGMTEEIAAALAELAPGRPFNTQFATILKQGTEPKFERGRQVDRFEGTRPMLEAFFHARFFLEMAVHYGKILRCPPMPLPSGWAALLYLYGLRA